MLASVGRVPSVVGGSPASPAGLAVDPFARTLYWTEPTGVWRSELDGTDEVLLLATTLQHPVAVALDPVHRRVDWTLMIRTDGFLGGNRSDDWIRTKTPQIRLHRDLKLLLDHVVRQIENRNF